MLTLKNAGYERGEMTLLAEVLTNAHVDVMQAVKCDGCCESCKGRHVCGDLARLIAYVNDVRTNARKAHDGES